jgi:hypothetical protein
MLPLVSSYSTYLLLLVAGLHVHATAGAGSAILVKDGRHHLPFDVRRYLLLESSPTSSSSSAAAVAVVEPTQRLLSGAGSAILREVLEILAKHATDNRNNGEPTLLALRQGRYLQEDAPDELTFDDVCGFLTGIINEGSEGAIVCTCTSDTSTLRCDTPADRPVCDGSFGTGICASLTMSITFLENFGVDEFTVGVNFTGVTDPSGPLRDGVVTAYFADDGTTLESCTATFDDENGVPTNCTSCYGCPDDPSTGGTSEAAGYLGFTLDCSNIYPGASTSGCYGVGGTVEEATALFPGSENGGGSGGSGGNGTFTNSTGGDGGGDGSGVDGGGDGSDGDGVSDGADGSDGGSDGEGGEDSEGGGGGSRSNSTNSSGGGSDNGIGASTGGGNTSAATYSGRSAAAAIAASVALALSL